MNKYMSLIGRNARKASLDKLIQKLKINFKKICLLIRQRKKIYT